MSPRGLPGDLRPTPRRTSGAREASPTTATGGQSGGGRGLQVPTSATSRPAQLAPVLALLSCALYCCNGELLQALQLHTPPTERHASPGVNLLLCHLGGLAFAPHFLFADSAFGAPSSSAGLTGGGAASSASAALSSRPRLTALLFALILMGYNYAWLLSTRFLAIAVTNALFQTSAAVVYAVSVPLFGEPLTSMRIMGVAMMLAGSMLASGALGVSKGGGSATAPLAGGGLAGASAGAALALLAAVGVAVYQVFFRHLFGHLKHDPRFLAYFGAWVSVWHVLVVLPLLLLASAAGLEAFELPRGYYAVAGTVASAAIASTVNALYLCIALWGSVMLLPCASALSVPLTVGLDMTLHGVYPAPMELCGHFLVVVAVVLIMDLAAKLISGKSRPGLGKLNGFSMAEI